MEPLRADIVERWSRPAAPPPVSRPVEPEPRRQRYVPPSLADLIRDVGRLIDHSEDAITGHGRARIVVHARSVIAVLAKLHHPRISGAAIDDALRRASGMAIWYWLRHEDRMALYAEYAALFRRCQSEFQNAPEPTGVGGGLRPDCNPGSGAATTSQVRQP